MWKRNSSNKAILPVVQNKKDLVLDKKRNGIRATWFILCVCGVYFYLRLILLIYNDFQTVSTPHIFFLKNNQKETTESLYPKFPYKINATNEYETIQHPGYAAIGDNKRHINVPMFWEPVGGRNRTAPNGGLMKYPDAVSFGSKLLLNGESYETIYVSIASYRDYMCPETVENIFVRAKYPHRIRVAVIDQKHTFDRKCVQPLVSCENDSSQVLCLFAQNIDTYEMDALLSVGPVFARHLGHRMYRGEYFAMQVDAHVRFTRNWDEDVISQWRSARNEMAVLSVYPSDIQNSINETDGSRIRKVRPIMCETDWEGGKIKYLRHGQQPEGTAFIHNQPTIHPFWAAGFSFGRGHFVVNVPYDQHLPMVFQGEEINIGIRGFTYGYDYYTPEKSVCYHMYAIGANKKKRQKVSLFWENANLFPGSAQKSFKRLVSIIKMPNHNQTYQDWDQSDQQKYGLGKVRKVEKFLKIYGIDIIKMEVQHNLCSFVGQPMQKVFVPALRQDHMGIDYDQIHFQYKNKMKNNQKRTLPPAK